jgi:aryl-alcohol dehydrogenase-like predicted oxidoreductase
VPFSEQFGVIRELRDEGKIRFAGVSEVSLDELRRASEIVEVATVQNRFNAAEQGASEVLAECEAADIAFLPWAPMAMGDLRPAEALEWLLRRSPVVLPIPGTGSVEHLRENMRAASAAAL